MSAKFKGFEDYFNVLRFFSSTSKSRKVTKNKTHSIHIRYLYFLIHDCLKQYKN